MKIVYICHPISGDVQQNLRDIATIVRDINLNRIDVIPFVPYYADCVALNDADPDHRERGIRNGKEYFERNIPDELWVYGDKLTTGMKDEIELAFDYDITIEAYTAETSILVSDFIKGLNNEK